MKLQPNFERSHDLFMDKMMRSKQLAYELKVGLNRID